MQPSGPNPYLKTKVLTASPEQLRLMLLEGAVKFCRQGRAALEKRDFEGMYNALSRAQKIVLELSNSLKHDADPDLCGKLAALYEYIYRRLVDANMERDFAAIDEAIRLLDYDRETWVLMMQKLQAERDGTAPVTPAPRPVEPARNPIASIGPNSSTGTRRASFSIQG